MRILLLPFALLYGLAVRLRSWFFDIGLLPTIRVDAAVISVGNCSAGGTGKTPLVELIVELLPKASGVAILSRGYGRRSSGLVVVQAEGKRLADAQAAGDELSQHADRFPECLIIADADRVRGAREAVARGAHIIVLDDGFQHRYLARDLDVVIVTAAEVLNGGFLLPAGNEREPMNALRRSDLIAVTRYAGRGEMEAVAQRLSRFDKPLCFLATKVRGLERAWDRASVPVASVRGRSAVAFSGIGDPPSFEQTLASLGVSVRHHVRFKDHHQYTRADLEAIRDSWRTSGADLILTTAKDAARLRGEEGMRFLRACPVQVVAIGLDVERGREQLHELLAKVLTE